jgi:alginate O-acetyltransferase complex protein AlgI
VLFSSPLYLFTFLPVTVAGYFIIGRWAPPLFARLWLLAASLLFYGYSAAQAIPLLFASIAVNFGIGLALGRFDERGKQKTFLYTGIVFNLLLLAYFKYTNFFLKTINAASDAHFGLLSLGFPLAISFYTFQQISFLVDCHQNKAEEKNFLNYCVFVTFFPQLVAGPIVRHREMMPQFAEGGVGLRDWNNIAKGLFVFGLGLFPIERKAVPNA